MMIKGKMMNWIKISCCERKTIELSVGHMTGHLVYRQMTEHFRAQGFQQSTEKGNAKRGFLHTAQEFSTLYLLQVKPCRGRYD